MDNSNEYNNWTSYDNVSIVYSGNGDIKQAKIADSKNKKQLNGVINSMKVARHIIHNGETSFETIMPDVIETENKGFKLKIIGTVTANHTKCLVKKDGVGEFSVAIDIDNVFSIIKQNTFINGECKDTLQFARHLGNLCMINSNMEEYKDLKNDKDIKKKLNTSKTRLWSIGKSYSTLKLEDLYLGKVYKPINIRVSKVVGTINIKVEPEAISAKHLLLPSFFVDKDKIHSCTELFKLCSNDEGIRLIDKTSNFSLLEHESGIYDHFTHTYFQDTLPARKAGSICLDVSNNYYDELENLITDVKKDILSRLNSDKNNEINLRLLSKYIISTTPYDKFSELDIELIKTAFDIDRIKNYYHATNSNVIITSNVPGLEFLNTK